MSSESNDEYLHQVKDEIRAQAQGLTQRPLLPRTAPSAPLRGRVDDGIERDRLDYRIGELTDLQYRLFVERAFCAILKRAPDGAETDAQLRVLARGSAKSEVLGNLRWSPEGRRVGVRIAGLLPRYALAKARGVPVLGYLLDWALTLAALPLMVRHQRATETLFAAGDDAAATTARNLTLRMDKLDASDARTRRSIDDLHAFAHDLAQSRDTQIVALAATESALRARIDALQAELASTVGRLDEMAFLRQRIYAMNHWSHQLGQAFERIETVAAERTAELGGRAERVALDVVAADVGRAERNRAWADALATRIHAQGSILVLSSGGDWLAELAARGLRVRGALAYRGLADTAGSRGVAVECAAPRDVLRRCADASLDGVSALALPTLLRDIPLPELLGQLRRILRDDGIVLLACAPELDALASALVAPGVSTMDTSLVAYALGAAGFADVTRVDATDGTLAWLARAAAPEACA